MFFMLFFVAPISKKRLLLQKGEYNQAEKYADLAINVDRYNPMGMFQLIVNYNDFMK